ncbi:MAG: mechanosensitive ion channel [Anaerostipes sp.]|jgi:small conductance mechanosensitive channel|nr:mechanosensitive ion channel [Anaerostipes sp.]
MTNSTYFQEVATSYVGKLSDFAGDLFVAVVILIVGLKLTKWMISIVKKGLERKDVDYGFISFACSFLKITLRCIVVFMAVEKLGVQGSTIVALLGSAGVAIGLALQGSLSNVAGGVLLLILKPFQVGDYILVEGSGCEGTVVSLDIFYTKLETVDNRVIVVPNGTMANSNLINNTKQEKRLIDLKIGVSYESDLSKVKQMIFHVLEQEERLILPEETKVFVNELGDSAVMLGVRAWVKTEDYMPVKWHLLEQIKLKFDEEDIEIPYNKLDVTICNS